MKRITIVTTAFAVLAFAACNKPAATTSTSSSQPTPSAQETPTAQSRGSTTVASQQNSAPTKEPEYRSVDPDKDGFTVELSSGGSISWTADGWMSSDSVTATAISTATPVKNAKIVLLDSGKCVNGKAETKDYGIIEMKSAGGFSADVLMTQDSITKVRAALK